ncbi:MAG: hypothetical protein WC558_16170 [Patulibacter sp.]
MTPHVGAYSLGLYQRVHRETDGRFSLSDEHVLEAQRALSARRAWWFDSSGTAGDWGVQAPTWGHAHYLLEWRLEATAGRWAVGFYRQAALLGNQDVYVLTRGKAYLSGFGCAGEARGGSLARVSAKRANPFSAQLAALLLQA